MSEGEADALVVFGLTGDLGEDRLLPAIAALHRLGRLDVPVVGVGRSDHSDDELREALAGHDEAAANAVSLSYVRGDAGDRSTFDRVADVLGGSDAPVVYAAIPPSLFEALTAALADSDIGPGATLVVEKPFGNDARSAATLYEQMTQRLGDDRLRIVDHFLAKAAVENLVTARSANALFDAALRAETVKAIHVEMHERGTAAGRGSFYDDVGVVADVVQNHVLQLSTFALMPPVAETAGLARLRERRAETLSSLAVRPESIVLAQYDGYRDHDGVDDDSLMPTYASFEMTSSLPRWADTPIYVSAGKGLDLDRTRVVFELAAPAGAPASTGTTSISFDVSPTASITTELWLLDPGAHGEAGPALARRQVELDAPSTHDGLDAYGALLDDALRGRSTHFATIDDVVEGWRVVAPLDERVSAGDSAALVTYQQGSSAAAITASGRTSR